MEQVTIQSINDRVDCENMAAQSWTILAVYPPIDDLAVCPVVRAVASGTDLEEVRSVADALVLAKESGLIDLLVDLPDYGDVFERVPSICVVPNVGTGKYRG